VYFVRSGKLKVVKTVNFRKIDKHGEFMTFDSLTDDPLKHEIGTGQVE
jgi:hypothetical protein